MDQILAEVGAIDDPVTRARVAHRVITETQDLILAMAVMRRQALRDCLDAGMTPVDIAIELGLSRSRIHQLLH